MRWLVLESMEVVVALGLSTNLNSDLTDGDKNLSLADKIKCTVDGSLNFF